MQCSDDVAVAQAIEFAQQQSTQPVMVGGVQTAELLLKR